REDRKIPAEGRGQKIRNDAVADVPAHQYRPDVRPIHPFQTVRAERQCLFDVALSDRSETPLRGYGKTTRAVALSRRGRIFYRRTRHVPVDAQSRYAGSKMGGQSQSGALVQDNR